MGKRYPSEQLQEWLDGRHMPAIEDEEELLVQYIQRHHENTWSYHARPIPAANSEVPHDWRYALPRR